MSSIHSRDNIGKEFNDLLPLRCVGSGVPEGHEFVDEVPAECIVHAKGTYIGERTDGEEEIALQHVFQPTACMVNGAEKFTGQPASAAAKVAYVTEVADF